MEPLFEAAERHGLTPTHVLLTHHHYDHVSEVGADPRALAGRPGPHPPAERATSRRRDRRRWTPARRSSVGGLDVQTLHIPGHTAGMLGLLVEGNVFTGDTLFKNSVGGVRAPGHTSYADLKPPSWTRCMALPPETVIRPGHTDPTTVAEEFENNAFIRVWRGLDPEGDEPCTALGEPATLILLGDDYDGGHKAWVRWPDGRDDIVPGCKVASA